MLQGILKMCWSLYNLMTILSYFVSSKFEMEKGSPTLSYCFLGNDVAL